MTLTTTSARIQFDRATLIIDGVPRIVLCSSLFYFRIPRALWRDRLRAVRDAGYTCIDVYFPWNFHELVEGVWDFDGERDTAAFLSLAAEEGLWVVARPGPYICSEWDGGGLPAYLLIQRAMRLRDNDPQFLEYVARWFDHLLPIIRRFQLGVEGTVIAVQLENELDFYNCGDPAGYIAALRDMALAHEIQVPLIACAGQGDLSRASGDVPGVVPTANFYPNDYDLTIEALVRPYEAALRARGLPLCITETNRRHLTLRRLLACGAKLLGPYLQASGTNFGFTNAINNWGDPLALLVSEYDLGGMIGPAGERRAEVAEARLLSRLIDALGPALAQAVPIRDHRISVTADVPLPEGGLSALALHGGGLLLALPNPGEAPGRVRLVREAPDWPIDAGLTVEPGHCPYVLLDLPLASWGIDGTLAVTTAEPALLRAEPNGALLVLHADSPAEAAFAFPCNATAEAQGMQVEHTRDAVVLHFDGRQQGTATIKLPDATLQVLVLSRAQATQLKYVMSDGTPVQAADRPSAPMISAPPALAWSAVELTEPATSLAEDVRALGAQPRFLEEVGITRGFGWYGAQMDLATTVHVTGLLLHDASDIVSVYWDGIYQGTVTPGGGCAYLPRRPGDIGVSNNLIVRAEIWGHSNFDDFRLPALRLHSLKGLSGITAVTRERALGSNWQWHPAGGTQSTSRYSGNEYAAPIVPWGRWLTNDQPEVGVYVKTVALSPEANSWVLHFTGLQALVHVAVNDQSCGVVNPLTPYVDISHCLQPGQPATIALSIERWHRQPAGDVTLLEGRRATDWWVAGAGEAELWAAAERWLPDAHGLTMPFGLRTGATGWLFGDVGALAALGGSWLVRCLGRNAKVTAWFNGHVVGRLWLLSSSRPVLVGGAPDMLYLPAPWFQPTDNLLALLVEGVEYGEAGEVTDLLIQPVQTGAG